MEKRFKALRIIATVYKILGFIAMVITILTVISICSTSVLGGAALDSIGNEFDDYSGFFGTFSGLVVGLIISLFIIMNGGGIALLFFSMGEGIYLLIALEENTRSTSYILSNQL